ncbi:MAG: hypothetical protein ACXQS2_05575 [Methermicoccaceae archaeon]
MKVELKLPDWLLENYIVEVGCDPYDGLKYLNIVKKRNFEAEEVKKIQSELREQFYLDRIFVRAEGCDRDYIVLHFVEMVVPNVEEESWG